MLMGLINDFDLGDKPKQVTKAKKKMNDFGLDIIKESESDESVKNTPNFTK